MDKRDYILEIVRSVTNSAAWLIVVMTIIAMFTCCKTKRCIQSKINTTDTYKINALQTDSINSFIQQFEESDIIRTAIAGSTTTLVIYDTQAEADETGSYPVKVRYTRRDSILAKQDQTGQITTQVKSESAHRQNNDIEQTSTESANITSCQSTDTGYSYARFATTTIIIALIICTIIIIRRRWITK